MLRVTRWVLLAGMLCLMCGMFTTVAIATTKHIGDHRTSRTARTCHRVKHRHCRPTHAKGKLHRKHKQHPRAAPSKSKSVPQSSSATAPWATVPSSVTPGAPSGSGTPSSGPAGPAAPVESPTTPPGPARVEVTAEDSEAFRFVLSRPTVPAGKVIIEFINHGQDEHNLNAIEPTEGSVEGSLPNTVSNAHLSLTLNLHPGSYTLFCSLPSHEAKGMKATLIAN